MGLYRFQFHALDGADPSVRDVDCANDGAAAEDAFRTLRENIALRAVEIFEAGRLVTRMERPGAAFLTSRAGIHGLG